MSDVDNKVKMIVEGLLLAAGRPLTLVNIAQVFAESERPDKKELKAVMAAITADCNDKGFELKEVASGYRFQVKQEIGEWVAKLWEERPPRYTRALLETLALIAYRQPITRGDIEEIRGVAVSPNIMRTLLDREWVRVVGHRDVPGRPALFATTRQFLDYFNIKSLQELPTLSDIKELAQSEPEMDLAEELAKQRVIELPDEQSDELPDEESDEESDEARQQNETEIAELLAEAAAVELAKKPLDEILGMDPYDENEKPDESDPNEEAFADHDSDAETDAEQVISPVKGSNAGDELPEGQVTETNAEDTATDLEKPDFDELDENINLADPDAEDWTEPGSQSNSQPDFQSNYQLDNIAREAEKSAMQNDKTAASADGQLEESSEAGSEWDKQNNLPNTSDDSHSETLPDSDVSDAKFSNRDAEDDL